MRQRAARQQRSEIEHGVLVLSDGIDGKLTHLADDFGQVVEAESSISRSRGRKFGLEKVPLVCDTRWLTVPGRSRLTSI